MECVKNMGETSNKASHESTNQIHRLSTSDAMRIFSSQENIKNLFPHKYFFAFNWGMPFCVNEMNLKIVAKATNVSATFSVDGATCESVTFASLHPLLTSSVRLDLYMYGSKMTAQMVVDHTYFWLRYVPTILTSGVTSVSLLVHFPVDVNKDAAFSESQVRTRRCLRHCDV